MPKNKKTDPREFEVEFAEGCFDDFEGDQAELDEFIAAIKQAVKDGTLFENAVLLEDEDYPGLQRGEFNLPKNTRN